MGTVGDYIMGEWELTEKLWLTFLVLFSATLASLRTISS